MFVGLPHEASLALVPQLVGAVPCVVDLSAAFRLNDASRYPRWYGFEYDQSALLDRSGIEGILGTVAGDDTLMCVAEETVGGKALESVLRELASLS